MLRSLTALMLGFSLLTSSALVTAQDHPPHQWNAQEDPHWHDYLKAHHKKDHDWSEATKREQIAYWKWRDAHPDAH